MRNHYAKEPPPVGTLVRFEYKAWRIAEIRERPGNRYQVYLRPPGDQFDLAQYNYPVSGPAHARWEVLDEHYSVCAIDGDVQPCRHRDAEKKADELVALAKRYETWGLCPSCGKEVTPRMKSRTFDENLMVPLGPPVVFHLRDSCYRDAAAYEQKWADATGGQKVLTCEGTLTKHADGHLECSTEGCVVADYGHDTRAVCWRDRTPCSACEPYVEARRAENRNTPKETR